MRRKDKQITDYAQMLEVLKGCDVCRIALQDEGVPYVVPMNFGMEDADGTLVLYFHGAKEGRKIDLIEKNAGAAAFEADTDHELIEGTTGCMYSYRYHSVMGEGTVEVVTDFEQKEHGLKKLLEQYGAQVPMKREYIEKTCVLKMTVKEWSCKGC